MLGYVTALSWKLLCLCVVGKVSGKLWEGILWLCNEGLKWMCRNISNLSWVGKVNVLLGTKRFFPSRRLTSGSIQILIQLFPHTLSSQDGRIENKMKNTSWVRIKAKISARSKAKRQIHSLLSISREMSSNWTLESRVPAHVAIALDSVA